MSLITLHNVTLHLGGHCLLDAVDWQIQPKERIALVGRNGAGKSSLLNLLQGSLVVDSGQLNYLSGLRVASLTQDVPVTQDESVYHFLVKGLGKVGEVLADFYALSKNQDMEKRDKCHQQMDALNAWEFLPKVELMASRLSLQLDDAMQALSGGLKRRTLLAAALIAEPDLLILDEPTNHLDITTIEWLEAYLKNYKGSLLVVTHDRAFLDVVATSIVCLDRGKLYTYNCDYKTYLERKEAFESTEEKHNALFDKRLNQEETWIRTGVKARRTRNEGRVRALKAMREAHKARRLQAGKVTGLNLTTTSSGKMVIEAKKIDYTLSGKKLLHDFSLILTAGDKLGIIGPNGCGKTTLVRLLLGEIKDFSGKLKQGTSLEIAYFDQLRQQLDENQTVMANVAEGADYVCINGKQKHVATYLKEFLFSPERFNQAVSTLSGGEKNRLMLAKLLAKPVNFLVMDEPTNDLDMETLELLENMLVEYTGTLILISHDREFINQVVTSVLVWEEDGRFVEYVGGYDDYRRQKPSKTEKSATVKLEKNEAATGAKLNFKEQRELTQLPKKIEALEAKIAATHQKMTQAEYYQQPASVLTTDNQQLTEDEQSLASLYARWEYLETKR